MWDLSARAIFWQIWLERNNRIFNLVALPIQTIFYKTANLLLLWLFTDSEPQQQPIMEALQRIKLSLNFMSARGADLANNSELNLIQE